MDGTSDVSDRVDTDASTNVQVAHGRRLRDDPGMLCFDIGDGDSLRFFERGDASELFALVDKNREHLREFLGWVDSTNSVDVISQYITRSRRQFHEGGFLGAVCVGDRIAGSVGFRDVIDWRNGRAELGYWLGSEFEGRGTMTRAVMALTDHALGTMELERVVINAVVNNRKSRAVADRAGYVFEGIRRAAERLNGQVVDHALYSKVRADLG